VADGLVELFDMSATLLDVAGVEQPDYFQGQSLMPTLKGDCDGKNMRNSVRCEYFDALDSNFTGGDGSFATMYREGNYKISIYHNKNLGELYDLEKDPWEFDNLWDDPEHTELKSSLILKSFNNHVIYTTDVGSERIAPM
jgi:arylsulfatase A-like enzyme